KNNDILLLKKPFKQAKDICLIFSYIIVLLYGMGVNKMVSNSLHFFLAGFSCPYRHFPEKLAGICGYNICMKYLGKLYTKVSFTYCRRPCHYHQFFVIVLH